jgi:hypothetical protein
MPAESPERISRRYGTYSNKAIKDSQTSREQVQIDSRQPNSFHSDVDIRYVFRNMWNGDS